MKISSTAQVSAQLVQVRSSARWVTFCVRATCEASGHIHSRQCLVPRQTSALQYTPLKWPSTCRMRCFAAHSYYMYLAVECWRKVLLSLLQFLTVAARSCLLLVPYCLADLPGQRNVDTTRMPRSLKGQASQEVQIFFQSAESSSWKSEARWKESTKTIWICDVSVRACDHRTGTTY